MITLCDNPVFTCIMLNPVFTCIMFNPVFTCIMLIISGDWWRWELVEEHRNRHEDNIMCLGLRIQRSIMRILLLLFNSTIFIISTLFDFLGYWCVHGYTSSIMLSDYIKCIHLINLRMCNVLIISLVNIHVQYDFDWYSLLFYLKSFLIFE